MEGGLSLEELVASTSKVTLKDIRPLLVKHGLDNHKYLRLLAFNWVANGLFILGIVLVGVLSSQESSWPLFTFLIILLFYFYVNFSLRQTFREHILIVVQAIFKEHNLQSALAVKHFIQQNAFDQLGIFPPSKKVSGNAFFKGGNTALEFKASNLVATKPNSGILSDAYFLGFFMQIKFRNSRVQDYLRFRTKNDFPIDLLDQGNDVSQCYDMLDEGGEKTANASIPSLLKAKTPFLSIATSSDKQIECILKDEEVFILIHNDWFLFKTPSKARRDYGRKHIEYSGVVKDALMVIEVLKDVELLLDA